MPLKLFDFHEKFMIGAYKIKLTQFKKTGSIDQIFISLGNLIKCHFRNYKSITFFVNFTFLLLNSGVCVPFNRGNEVNLKKNQKSNREKTNTRVNKF